MSYRILYNKYFNKFKKSGLNTRFVLDIFEYYLNTKINSIFLDELDKNVNIIKYLKISKSLDKILNGYPKEYITHNAYFYGLELYVDKNVLIPRDETEELVEWVLKDNIDNNLKVIDLCSGSGCIGIALKYLKKDWDVTCIDISKNANKIGIRNAKKYNTSVRFIESNLLENYKDSFDILVSNPPYIYVFDKEVSLSVRKNEPSLALFVNDEKGIEMYKRIFDYLKDLDFKKAYFEFGYNQKEDLITLLKQYNFKYEFRKDINSKDRMLKIEKVL